MTAVRRINSLEIQDFRVLSGKYTLDLNADIVLIHGPNAAGKSSLLAGLELALTGQIQSLARVTKDYAKYLVTDGSDESHCSVIVNSGDVATTYAATVRGSKVQTQSHISPAEVQFYNERAYLDQSTLGRLLEIYENADSSGKSPLVQFVNDLLGLDRLDALIDGLAKSRSISSTRALVAGVKSVQTDFERSEQKHQSAANEATMMEAAIRQTAGELLSGDSTAMATDQLKAAIQEIVERTQTEKVLVLEQASQLVEIESRLVALSSQIASVGDQSVDSGAAKHADQVKAAEDSWASWRAEHETPILELATEIAALIPELERSGTGDVDPQPFVTSLVARLDAAILSLRTIVDEQSKIIVSLDDLNRQAAEATAELNLLDSADGSASDQSHSDAVLTLLHEVSTHLEDEHCPVCGRDFSEIEEGTLSARIQSMTEVVAEDAQARAAHRTARILAAERAAQIQAEITNSSGRQLNHDQLQNATSRLVQLSTLAQRTRSYTAEAAVGSSHRMALLQLRANQASLESASILRTQVLKSLSEFARDFEVPNGMPASKLLASVSQAVANRQATNSQKVQEVATTTSRCAAVLEELEKLELLRADVAQTSTRRGELERELAVINARMLAARRLDDACRAERARVVAQVFDEQLNATWLDLFTRLAPDERFVPRLEPTAMKARGKASPLKVLNRVSGAEAPPGATLSAGNLNTAALTLFLSLHLSSKPQLPWIVLDDPIQSMDDIHVSQFSTILRRLAYEEDRQVIVAVHERALFEYLSLELSPPSEGRKLITHELKVGTNSTEISQVPYEWAPDPVIDAHLEAS